MSFSSSTERVPTSSLKGGDVIAGFRLERELEPAVPGAIRWEATQLSLDRRVAVEFLPPSSGAAVRIDAPAAPTGEHLLAARITDYGLMVVTQLIDRDDRAGRTADPARRRPPLALLLGGVAAGGIAVIVTLATTTGRPVLPPVAPGEQSLGSALGAGASRSVDCTGKPPSGASQACTLVQTALRGRPVAAAQSGSIRRWLVRGARGQLALQVLHRQGSRYVWRARTPYRTVRSTGIQILPAALPLAAGDLVGVDLAPGAAIGIPDQGGVAATARWFGVPSLVTPVRVFRRASDTGPADELLLRVDYAPGAKRATPGLVVGRAAASLKPGRPLVAQDVEPVPGVVRTVRVVLLGGQVAVDLLAGGTRLARLPVPGADPTGHVLDLTTFGRPSVRLRYRNPRGALVEHTYDVGVDSLATES